MKPDRILKSIDGYVNQNGFKLPSAILPNTGWTMVCLPDVLLEEVKKNMEPNYAFDPERLESMQ